jgi:MFS family permease
MRKLHYAWIMLLLCFLGLLAAQGVRLSFGAFIEPWERTFQVDRSVVSFVSFLSFVVYGLAQPFVGRLVDRYGIRRVLSLSVLLVGVGLLATAFARTPLQLMLIYGVIASLGFGGASGVVASVAVTTWFETRRGLAFGIVEAGFAVGQLVLVPTSLLLIQAWGWQRTMIALGLGLSLVIFPLLLLLLRRPRSARSRMARLSRPRCATSQARSNRSQPRRTRSSSSARSGAWRCRSSSAASPPPA